LWKEPPISPVEYYITIIAIYIGTDLIAAWGLNLEFGVTGVPNLAYIVFFACGAYTYSVLTVGPASQFGGSETYIIGARIDPALAILVAIVVSAAFGIFIGLTGLRRLRLDYQALAFLIISFVAIGLVGADSSIFNGLDGMSLVPNPLGAGKHSPSAWAYVVIVAIACVVTILFVRQLTNGPLGRALRAVRDDESAALAIGKNVTWMRLMVQGIGAGLAGLSGALLVGFIGGWSPAAWAYVETLALMTGIMVGGRGNNKGVTIGTILVLGAFLQGVQYLPTVPGRPGTPEDIGWIIVGALTIAFLFSRPQGIFPERRPRYGERAAFGKGRSLFGDLPAPVAVAARAATGAGAEPGATAPAEEEAAGTAPEPGAAAQPRAPVIDLRAVTRRPAPAAGGEPAPTGAAAAGGPVLVVRDLVKSYGGVRAVDSVGFTVPEATIVGLIGPNGAGKTTVLGIVSGFIRPEAGSVHYDGADITRMAPYRRARIGLVRTFQLAREFPKLTATENLMVAALGQRGEHLLGSIVGSPLFGAEEERLLERARRLLGMFGLTHLADTLAGHLSGGQKRLLEVTRALMLDPKVLLLDEPMAGLSPAISEQLEGACMALRDAGVSVLLVEHELGSVERLCDNVVMMAQGRVLAEGPMDELRRSAQVQEAYFVG
jgi:ABC-type branched-subunit amino acid transport system ATPase component/ABC-type branched-subunit amino acid transport system permease subunit